MSIDLAEETYYVAKGGRIPLKWTAPEALHYRKYSTASDIWSYGCLMYEIWGLGEKPFGATKNRKVRFPYNRFKDLWSENCLVRLFHRLIQDTDYLHHLDVQKQSIKSWLIAGKIIRSTFCDDQQVKAKKSELVIIMCNGIGIIITLF